MYSNIVIYICQLSDGPICMDVGTCYIEVGPSLHTYCNIHILGPYLYRYRTFSYSWNIIVLGTTVITTIQISLLVTR